jgi:hypothetical protein
MLAARDYPCNSIAGRLPITQLALADLVYFVKEHMIRDWMTFADWK